MKFLVTGFEPFGGEARNPSAEVVEVLPGAVAGAEIIKLILPTTRFEAPERVERAVEAHRPDVVLSIGQAGGRAAVSVERFAVNLDDYRIPDNYPFAGKDFNATSAGIHVDGLAKNEEIYNIFDTTKILNRSVPIIINDKAGRAGVAYWINQQFNLPPERQVSKKHPAVGQIHTRIMAAYEEGRNTSFSNKEIKNLVRRFMPELFDSEFDQMKRIAGELASNLVERLARDCQSTADSEALTAQLQHFVRDYSFIQYAYVTDVKGHSTAIAISDPGDQKGYKAFPIGFDYSNREWFLQPMRTGKLHITNVHQSQVTGQLIITVSTVITDANDEIIGVLGADIQLEEIIRRAESLEAEVPNSEEE